MHDILFCFQKFRNSMQSLPIFFIQAYLVLIPSFLISVDIVCDVIRGVLDVNSNAGNGHRGQNGGDGASARDSGSTVRSVV